MSTHRPRENEESNRPPTTASSRGACLRGRGFTDGEAGLRHGTDRRPPYMWATYDCDEPLTCVAFSPDGRFVLTYALLQALSPSHLWSVPNG